METVLVDDADRPLLERFKWRVGNRGYVVRETWSNYERHVVLLHRAILGLTPADKVEVDHRNGNKLDNRRSNLRLATRQLQQQNVASHRDSNSRYRGVCWDRRRGRWRAHAHVGGRHRHLGYFTDEAAAARVAADFRREHMPGAIDR
jgi:hypothetical protein